ncbi:MAG: NAD-dependent DNA ligase LigA [Treponema sp.]|jgi:DNA ligase (NAD+)|nr:NAD-dependent DNA ligase LigA [Treponema sp.]
MAKKENRVKTLEALIKKYQKSYYDGEAVISDAEFDLLWDELKNLDPDNALLKKVGGTGKKPAVGEVTDTDGFPKARHIIPMGSQDKAANPAEFLAWAGKIKPKSFVTQFKLDGASLELQYDKGRLKAAVTRGDGVYGDEITANARAMKVPEKLKAVFSGGIRGEVVMLHEVWNKKYSDKANCRNAANGIMRRKDGIGCEDLCFIAYDASVPGDDNFFTDEIKKIRWLTDQGFSTAETKEFKTPEEVIAFREEIVEKRKDLALDIDGLVIKDRIIDMTDLRRDRPERQIAFKFDLETAFSILRKVEWSESGATYTPIGIVDSVRIAGTTVQRANLNNPGLLRAMGLRIGSGVTVVKRGEIIPKIEGLAPEGAIEEPVEKQDIEYPSICSSCGSKLEDAGTRLFCPNNSCPKRLHHRLEKWVSILDIRELGVKLLAQLFESNRVRHIPDLYTLNEKELAAFERMGDLSAAKVIRHIRTKRELSLAVFIAGFDFEGVGELIVEKAVTEGFDTLEKLRNASVNDLASVYGLGEITARVIVSGLEECKAEMGEVLSYGIISIAAPDRQDLHLKGKSFCFTGELKTMKRNEAEEKVKSLGGSAKNSVVKELSYLVTNDPESGSSKNRKATDLGIPIIDEKAFLALLENAAGDKINAQGELF